MRGKPSIKSGQTGGDSLKVEMLEVVEMLPDYL
jgi:hypothetical protein